MGGRSKTQTVRKRDPEPQELTNMRNGIYSMISPILSGNMENSSSPFAQDWTNARNRIGNAWDRFGELEKQMPGLVGNVTNAAGRIENLSGRLPGYADRIEALTGQYDPYRQKIDKVSGEMNDLSNQMPGYADKINSATGTLQGYAGEMADLARTGKVSQAMTDTMNASVNRAMNQGMGSSLNDLAARGVLNSSVTNKSLNQMNDAAADAYAKNYQGTFNSALAALQGAAGAQNSAIGGYQAAAGTLRDALAGKNAVLGGYKTGIDALSSQIGGHKAAADTVGSAISGQNAALGGYKTALDTHSGLMKDYLAMPDKIMDSTMASYKPVYNFWKDWQNSYDRREDFDTIVKQGK